MQKFDRIYNIADISIGYSFREAIRQSSDQSAVPVIQAKNIRKDDLYVGSDDLIFTENLGFKENAFIQKNDVVIGSRGVFRAGVVASEANTIASASVFILRVTNQTSLLPEYLAVYLNSTAGQRQLTKKLATGAIKSIRKRDLMEMVLPVPSVEQQQNIVNLYQNILKQTHLLKQKLNIYKNVSTSIFNAIEKGV